MVMREGFVPSLSFLLGVPPSTAAARISRNCAPCTIPRAKVCAFCLLLLSRNYGIMYTESEERIMNRTPMGRQLDFDLKYKMNNNDCIKFIEKEKKKLLTNK